MKYFLPLLALLTMLHTKAAEVTLASLNGTWVMTGAERNGREIPGSDLGGIELEILNGKYTFRMGSNVTEGRFTLDATKSPIWMDIVSTGGSEGETHLRAIVGSTEDGWQICYSVAPAARPTRFETEPDSSQFLAQYVRKPGTIAPVVRPLPLRALLISGGCCHDYPGQDIVLSEGLSRRANIAFTIVRDEGKNGTQHKVSVYHKDDWSKDYDVVLHNECYADEKDPAWLERIVQPHRDGLPAVVIHCAMHSYRVPNTEWFKFVGVTSHRHGSHFDYLMTNVKPEHPIMKDFPPVWRTPKDELYNIEKVEASATPLATGWSHETKRGEVNVWINQYGDGRVFGTTIGHYNHTLNDPVILDLLTRGLLWSCDKLDADGKPLPGYESRSSHP